MTVPAASPARSHKHCRPIKVVRLPTGSMEVEYLQAGTIVSAIAQEYPKAHRVSVPSSTAPTTEK
jgi:hypothetical protein